MGWPLILGPRVVGVLGSEGSWSQGSGGRFWVMYSIRNVLRHVRTPILNSCKDSLWEFIRVSAVNNSANHTTRRIGFQNCVRRTILWQLHVLLSLLSVLSFFGMFASSTSMSFLTKEGCETVLLQSSPLAFCRHSFVMQISPLVFQLELPHASRSCCPWVANESVFRTASA